MSFMRCCVKLRTLKREVCMIAETGRFKVYFRIPFFKYFIGYDMDYKKLCLMYKVFDSAWGQYRWKVV